jgi:hypothetical protein
VRAQSWANDPTWSVPPWAVNISLEHCLRTKYGDDIAAPFETLRLEAARIANDFAQKYIDEEITISEYPLACHYLRQLTESGRAKFRQHVDSNTHNGHPHSRVTVVCKLSHGCAPGLGKLDDCVVCYRAQLKT